MEVYRADKNFNFEKISLANPQPIQGGSFFTKLTLNNNPLYIQLPKCNTKQGIITTKRNKYSDLLYDKSNEEFLINWALSLEDKCQELIYHKRNTWFHQEIQKDDIETMLSPVFRLYKSGKKLLIRAYIDVNKENGTPKCMAYDEHELKVDLETIDPEKFIIPLVLIEGIRFSSKSFELDIKLTQIMVLDDEPMASNTCLIKKTNISTEIKEDNKTEILEDSKRDSLEPKDETKVDEDSLEPKDEMKVDEDSLEPKDMVKVDEDSLEPKDMVKVDEDSLEPTDMVKADEDSLEPKDMVKVDENSLEITSPVKNSETSQVTLDNTIEEVHLQVNDEDCIKLKKPNEVYYEIYKAARTKAKQMRRVAVEAYLEAKNIKTKYALDDIDDSSNSEDSEEDEITDDENGLNL